MARRDNAIAGLVLFSVLGGCTGAIGDGGAAAPEVRIGADGRPVPTEELPPGTPGASGADMAPPVLTCDRSVDSSGPARAYRLSPDEFATTVERAFGYDVGTQENPFAGVRGEGFFSDESSDGRIPLVVARRLWTLAPLVAASALDRSGPCDDAGCLRRVLTPVVAEATRRDVDDAMVERLVRVALAERDAGGDGLTLAYATLLAEPNVLFRWEDGQGTPAFTSPEGRPAMSARALAEWLSFRLTDHPPADDLYRSLSDRDGVEQAALRLAESGAARAVYHRFLEEYFFYAGAEDAFKEAADEVGYDGAALVRSTRAWFDALIDAPNFFESLMQSEDVYVDRDTAAIHGLESNSGELERVRDARRRGLLTQPAFLAAFGLPDETDPIRRGLFIREHLLCDGLPPVPLDVVDPIPDTEGATLRERLGEHVSNRRCSSCHDLMDPLGLTLEGFDHFGRVRTEEQGRPVDTSGEVLGGTDIDGPLTGAEDLADRLAGSAQAKACFVRHAFRFLHGRPVREADACAIEDALAAWDAAEGRLPALFAALAASEPALYRTEPSE
ncbi:MAG: DUF1588 domain-containing protein [Myxococcota bacterium]